MRCPKIWVLRAREKQLLSWWLLVFVVNIHAYGGICAEKRCSPCPPAHPRQRPCEYKEWALNAGTLGWDTHGLDTPWTAPPLGSCSGVRKWGSDSPLFSTPTDPSSSFVPLPKNISSYSKVGWYGGEGNPLSPFHPRHFVFSSTQISHAWSPLQSPLLPSSSTRDWDGQIHQKLVLFFHDEQKGLDY